MAVVKGAKHARAAKRMPAPERQDRISLLLAQSGYLSISDIAEQMTVSDMTVRRDLDVLAAQGLAAKAFGGAVSLAGGRAARMDIDEPVIEERIRRNSDAKAKIGRKAAGLVGAHQTIAIDIGSTTLCLAHAIMESDVRVFTNSLKIAMLLSSGRPHIYMPGGEIRGSEPSTIGSMAQQQLAHFRFDLAFLGASGVAADGFYDYSLEDTEIKRALIGRAEKTVALIDSSKFDRLSVVKVAELQAIDMLITERRPDDALAAHLAAAGVDIAVAD